MKRQHIVPPPLPPLHEKEKLRGSHRETDTGVLPRPEAEKLIRMMQDRVTGKKPREGWIDLPKNEGEGRGQYHFDPHMIRLDLTEKTVSCFGYYSNDESCWLIQVRFLAVRPPRQPVRFEMTSWFNLDNPAKIPYVH